MLTRIRIKGYKSLHDIEVRLSPPAVMFAPNAASITPNLDRMEFAEKVVQQMDIGCAE